MKPIIVLSVFFILLTSSIVNAQKMPIFQLGIKGGANVTKIDGVSFEDEFKFGYHLGGFAIVKLSDVIQIQPEVLFNQFNTRTSDDFNDIGNQYKDVRLNYLSIPLLLNITPAKILSFQVGPQYGILLNDGDNLVENGRNAFKNGELSMLGGVQFNIANFKISGRYMVGLNDIGDLPNNEEWKNQGFQVSVGLRIL